MYFRVSVSNQRVNVKQVLLKAKSTKDANAMIPDVEKMLFPNEKCETFIRKVDVKMELSHTEAYYEFIVTADLKNDDKIDAKEPDEFYTILKAENEKKAWEEAERMFKDEGVQTICVEPVSAKELLDEEINHLKYDLAYEKYPNETVRSFHKLMHDDEVVYDLLVEKHRKEKLTKSIKAEIDLNKITAAELDSYIDRLHGCNEKEQYQSLHNEIIAKYGK